MGLFGYTEDDAQRAMQQKDDEIAQLRRELASRPGGATSKVTVDDVDVTSMEVRQVQVKLPPFSESNPALWFGKAESQFILKGIKDDTTKFHHIYSLLTEKAANEIEYLLLNPPKTGKVEAMKAKIIKRFGRTQLDKDMELLSTRSLGDLKPSEMWSRFQQLNKDPHNSTSSFVKAYLVSMYPSEVKVAIANMTFADNDEMTEAADNALENLKSKPHQVNAVTTEVPDQFEVDAISRGSGGFRGRGASQRGGTRGAGRGNVTGG